MFTWGQPYKPQPKKEPEPAPDNAYEELDPVHQWRLEQFVKLGFGDFPSFLLVAAGADYREARRLLAIGASRDWIFTYLT